MLSSKRIRDKIEQRTSNVIRQSYRDTGKTYSKAPTIPVSNKKKHKVVISNRAKAYSSLEIHTIERFVLSLESGLEKSEIYSESLEIQQHVECIKKELTDIKNDIKNEFLTNEEITYVEKIHDKEF